jgi:hypothetical protein
MKLKVTFIFLFMSLCIFQIYIIYQIYIYKIKNEINQKKL